MENKDMKNKDMGNRNKRKLYIAAAAVIAVLVVVIAVISLRNTRNGEEGAEPPAQENPAGDKSAEEGGDSAGASEEDSVEMTAMYIPITEDVHLFIGQGENEGSVFTVRFPEEIYDIEGDKITKEQLKRGNIVKITGNGIMLESWPGQYPGVTRLDVTKKGSPSDADAYQEIVDEFYQEPDPKEPPFLNAEYTTELAVATSMVTRGGYEWTYYDRDGASVSAVADSEPVLLWSEELLNPIRLQEPVDITLSFSEKTTEVQVTRWTVDLWKSGEQLADAQLPQGEPVETQMRDGKTVIPAVEAGYVYAVTGIFENGRADYGFMTTS